MKEPNIKETAFSCPHCGAYTTQHWYDGYVKYISKDTPYIGNNEFEKIVKSDSVLKDEQKNRFLEMNKKMISKLLFLAEKEDYTNISQLNNLFMSQCYNCHKWAIWVNEDMIYPPKKFGALPNQDLPPDIFAVVDEARSIIDLSPKGAAALLRLSIQMLCKFLGEKGKDLNDDIGNLVRKGLDPKVSKSLDIVRVIGGEAVHPGSIDLNDNRDIAVRLFDLLNIITTQMITHPKTIDELYEKLPETKRAAIEKRDKEKEEK